MSSKFDKDFNLKNMNRIWIILNTHHMINFFLPIHPTKMSISTQPNDLTRSKLYNIAKDAFSWALKCVAPDKLLQNVMKLDEKKTKLIFSSQASKPVEFDLQQTPSIVVLGAGKATQELVSGLLHVVEDCHVPNLRIRVLANYPKGQKLIKFPSVPGVTVSVLEASHPISNEYTVDATNQQIQLLYNCDPGTLAIVLMSGGGSALFETTSSFGSALPYKINLEDLQVANIVLIESGANISEINVIRKHISQVKGGRTAQHAVRSGRISALVGLYLSDVIGNDLSSVASGPTCPDVSTFADCHAIIQKYNIRNRLPKSIIQHLDEASEETPKPGDPMFNGKVFNFMIGSADVSSQAAASYLSSCGFNTNIFSNQLDGEASAYGHHLVDFIAQKAKSSLTAPGSKVALLATGEFTVTIKGKGVGGRNQEMLLAFLQKLIETKKLGDVDFAVLSCAFDGIEGNSPATGAIVDSSSMQRVSVLASKAGNTSLELINQKLQNNDSFSVFEELQDAVITGYTGTNVNDLTLILLAKI